VSNAFRVKELQSVKVMVLLVIAETLCTRLWSEFFLILEVVLRQSIIVKDCQYKALVETQVMALKLHEAVKC
jgi:hypothetical protein